MERAKRFQAAPDPDRVEQLYGFVAEYIRTKRYAPTRQELGKALRLDSQRITLALRQLEAAGRIHLPKWGRWRRGITLATEPAFIASPGAKPLSVPALMAAPIVTVDMAIDWNRIVKNFRGVPVTKLTANQIARYYNKRCTEIGREHAEREANVLLGLRFPELFLERRQKLDVNGFDDRQRAKRGCRSCGTKFRKLRPNQLYCSAKCRRREKRHRREATPHGRLLKSQQNKRYRERHVEQERDRRRQWRLDHPGERSAQRSRELTRRRLDTAWNRKRFRAKPAALASLLHA